MNRYLRWASVAAALGAMAFWMKRRQKPAHIDPYSLGPVSSEWFIDHRNEM
jgi:hypothetical protein